MEKPLSLTLLYTSHLGGDIRLLPRLYTFIQRLKPARRQGVLLFDLGHACADEVWHCRLTQGRSMLIALDGMGFHAANVAGADGRQVEAQMTMGLVDEGQDWIYHIPPVIDRSITATVGPADSAARLQICLSAADKTRIQGNVLYLGDVRAGQVGLVRVDLHSAPRIIASGVHDMPSGTLPNPSLAATVEFVESEARYLQKK